ncbi:MAG: hypothetical protein J5940_06935 [Clostridia bacterium]|nr:hypothetical protein [Clostridia bacterium]
MSDNFKDTMYLTVKLLLTQFVTAVFGLMTCGPAYALKEKSALLAVFAVFAALFYWFLLYTEVFRTGLREGMQIRAGRRKNVPLKGLIVGLLYNIPNLILEILLLVGVFYSGYEGVEKMFDVASVAALLWEGAYSGVALMWFSNRLYVWLYLAAPLMPVIVCTVGYIFGVKQIGYIPPKKQD